MVELAGAKANEGGVRKLVERVEEKGVQPNDKFNIAVNGQRLLRCVRSRTEKPVAQRQPSHEHRQDHGLRLDRAPEH